MSSRANLLRKKLREKKENSKTKDLSKKDENSSVDNSNAPDSQTKASPAPFKPSDLNKSKAFCQRKEPEKKKVEEIDPLNFFNVEHNEIGGNKELNELLDIIEVVDNKGENKKEETKKEKESEEGSGSSSESDDGGITEEQRLLNKKLAQEKLFKKKENRVLPTNNLFKPTKNKISENMTKEVIMEKFGDDFDGAVELPELNEQKKQIMLKKMRKTINKLSSLRIQKHMDSELRHMIEDKIEDLKKIKGANYSKIEGKVQELILSLKQPDFYFADDEDVHQITDVQEPYDIKPKTDIDFAFFMKQVPKTN